jgi:hypothetical protein
LLGREATGDLKLKKNDTSKYKVGDFLKIKTAVIDNFERIVVKDYEEEHQLKLFEIIAVYFVHKESPPSYMILIEPNMIGWNVSKSHQLYYDLNEGLLGRKFYDVTDDFIVE